jgi:NAD+ diphosphatase
MSFRLFDLPEYEPSSFIGLSGNRLDRQSEKRGDDALHLALADRRARLMLMTSGRLLVKVNGAGVDPHFEADEIALLAASADQAVLLGFSADGPILAAASAADLEKLPENIKAIDYRSVYVQGLLDSERAGAMAQGAALLGWHSTHRYCGRCGAETRAAAGGYKRVCSNCKAEHFPRTDPVVIMLAVTRDRCLMGRGRHFTPGTFSALAGFVEPGETIENAVRRETLEEAGIRLGRVAYYASQPWPFPYSLMIGCFGEALNDDIQPDLGELEACRWFSREEVGLILDARHPDGILLPPRAGIAHHLVRAWAEAG